MALSSVRCSVVVSRRFLRNAACLQNSVAPNERVVMPASTQVRPSSEWQLVGAVALERKPVITRDFNEFERRYLEMLRTIEVEASLLSDHELQVKAESQRKASADEGSGIKIQTANDIAEEWNKKAKEFQPASRLTDGGASFGGSLWQWPGGAVSRQCSGRVLQVPLSGGVPERRDRGGKGVLLQGSTPGRIAFGGLPKEARQGQRFRMANPNRARIKNAAQVLSVRQVVSHVHRKDGLSTPLGQNSIIGQTKQPTHHS
ncbi:uncharacterized protein LOC121832854 isoform X2 [Ixodes scapularis]|uniref:uncharacterized protein LOC121832854 isoform X2 n=1 Tax=Ixodes scapularis TaxID=6945 RepID=UPI001A9E3130|nr:uncharacterized protein LOC121832854 isoform X2 [Ixodes scapularis]